MLIIKADFIVYIPVIWVKEQKLIDNLTTII